ncbi:MAG TPA: thioesterase family protein [Chloroflexota bacterium]
MDDQHLPLNVYRTRVRTYMTDLNAAMYHAAYLDLFDDARIEAFRRMGYTYERMVAGNWGVMIRSIQCRFFAPALMDDLLSITVQIPALSTATLTARYECRRDDELLAVGENVYVFIGGAGKPIRVPPDLEQVIEENAGLLAFTR